MYGISEIKHKMNTWPQVVDGSVRPDVSLLKLLRISMQFDAGDLYDSGQ